MKRQSVEWVKIFARQVSNMGYKYPNYIRNSYNQEQKKQVTQLKNRQGLNIFPKKT